MAYKAPREHLFEQLGLPGNAPGGRAQGRGRLLIFDKASPAALTLSPRRSDHVREVTRRASEAVGLPYRATNHLLSAEAPTWSRRASTSRPRAARWTRGHSDLFDASLPWSRR